MVSPAVTQRLDRLLRGIGEDGFGKLQNSVVSVVFDSEVGKYFALPFAVSGIPLKLISISGKDDDESMIDLRIDSEMRAHGYASAFHKFNGNSSIDTIVGIEAELGYHGSSRVLEGSNVVIDCTNNEISKQSALQFSQKNGAIFISASVIPGYAKIEVFVPGRETSGYSILMPGMKGLEERVFESINGNPCLVKGAKLTKEMIAMFMGGIAADEAVRGILGGKEPLARPVYYKFGYGAEMFSPRAKGEELRFIDPAHFRDKSALIFGAGAIGANEAYWLARLGLKRVDCLDYDVVELTNIMRTLMYYDMVGWLKCAAASEKIKLISEGKTESGQIPAKLSPKWKPAMEYDVYFDGFDNFYSRDMVSQRGLKDFVPVISASGRFDGFDVEAYVPQTTLCFDCNFGLSQLAEKEQARVRQSCGIEYTPQNGWINQSAGALASLILANVLFLDKYGPAVNGMVLYDPNQDKRLFVNDKSGACYHRKGGAIEHNVR